MTIGKLAVAGTCLLAALAGDIAGAANINGGTVRKVYAAIPGSDAHVLSFNFAAVPGATRNVTAASGGDTIVVTFTAECILSGNTVQPSFNWIEIEIRDNGQPMAPTGDGESPLAFCSDPVYHTNSVQAVKRLSAGDHTIRVVAKIHQGGTGSLSGQLDDWALTILQAD